MLVTTAERRLPSIVAQLRPLACNPNTKIMTTQLQLGVFMEPGTSVVPLVSYVF